MTNELTIFENKQFGQIRTVEENSRILFCGKDVAEALGYAIPRKAIKDHCRAKGVLKRNTLTNGGKQELIFIDEGNLYRLITHSKLPEAEKFESWVFDEVLPAIRKTGSYQSKPADDYKIRNLAVKEMNARSRQAQTLVRLAQLTQNATCREAMIAQAANTASGRELLPLPNLPARTYTAEEIGAKLGISKQRVGRLTNLHNLKTDEYGGWFADFIQGVGEKQTFRYYETVIPVLKSLISGVAV